jgi:hypothetical protein
VISLPVRHRLLTGLLGDELVDRQSGWFNRTGRVI